MNKTILIGNITREIELKYLPSGTAIANTALAINRKWKDKNGQQQDETCFIDISVFGRTAEVLNEYCKKGSKILVEGRLKLDQWGDQNGGKRSKHSIVVESMQMLDSKQDNNNMPKQKPEVTHTYEKPNYQPNTPPEIDVSDSEIPF